MGKFKKACVWTGLTIGAAICSAAVSVICGYTKTNPIGMKYTIHRQKERLWKEYKEKDDKRETVQHNE